MLYINKKTIGPRMLPPAAKLKPTPIEITRQVLWKIESPMPANGPIREDFTAEIEDLSKFGSSAPCFSIEATKPVMKPETLGVVLNSSQCRL